MPNSVRRESCFPGRYVINYTLAAGKSRNTAGNGLPADHHRESHDFI